ncbi:hypothetical protein [Pyrodictium delaneyi]|uniref:hypothetical protein n=1 Tax=Pyrodictium delaneyi TaxID=1273541 RepID=UPI0012E2A3BC|nr:hypothetical protein [Pyrodictium delaneyi]
MASRNVNPKDYSRESRTSNSTSLRRIDDCLGILRSYALGAAHQLVGKLARKVSVAWLSSTLSGSSAIVAYSISDSPALLTAAGVLLSIGPLAEELLWIRLGLLR